MSILGFLFVAFVAYLVFKLIFDFILPVYRTTQRVRKGFREMQERMNGQSEQYGQQQNGTKQNQNSNTKGGVGEYIDFEEIKD
ncbi:MAG: hypothetical protein J7502_05300 [Flavisolibacter sp.]|nr:hypothetical protein [Flavisolibacter sp.]